MSTKRIVCRVLTGPTASGKSEFAMRLAEENHWAVFCMDSMQIYRGMNIGTDKPTEEDRRRVPHYLLDIRNPVDSFSVAEYVTESEKLRQKVKQDILFVGGTGLYLQAMMYPLGMGLVPANEELRSRLNHMAEKPDGKEALHAYLASLDPLTAARLPVNDVRRTIRAIEVTEATGIPFSGQPERIMDSNCEWRVISTEMDRSLLYSRIDRRVDQMIRDGLQDEVALLLRDGVPESAQSMQALGYKEMIACLKGQISLEKTAEAIKTGTRHYAKRQMTFLRRENAVQYVDVTKPDATDRMRRIFLQ